VLRRMCEDQLPMQWHRAKLTKVLFRGPEIPIFMWVAEHVQKYHALPKVETLVQAWPVMSAVSTPEPSSYYVEKVENAYFYGVINQANIESQAALKANQDDHHTARRILRMAGQSIAEQQFRTRVMDMVVDGSKAVWNEYHGVGKTQNLCWFGWDYMDHQSGGVGPGDLVSFVGRPAQGKASALSAKVLTVKGWKTMADIQVGDQLASVDGQPSEVLGVYPQGVQPLYELQFQDGRKTKVSADHLWEVWYREWDGPKVETTMQLIARLEQKRYVNRLSVRLFSGKYGQPVDTEFSPYLLGVLLGDGCMSKHNEVVLTSADQQIVDAVGKELRFHGLDLVVAGDLQYRVVDHRYGGSRGINRVVQWLTGFDLMGVKSSEKAIPQVFMDASRAQRLELLQGLMDTDGTAGKDGTTQFCSTSRVLAEQVQYLCRSIGGKSRIRTKTTSHQDAFIVSLMLEDRSEVFKLGRKKQRVAGMKTTHTNHRLVLSSIKAVEHEVCQCIAVSHPSKLYVTDDFVVTHNTWMMLYIALHNWRVHKKNVLFVSMEMSPLAIAQRVAAMYTQTPYGQLKVGGFSSQTYKKFEQAMAHFETETAKFWLVDGNLAVGVEEIYDLADILECQLVDIDGAYLLRHQDRRLNRFERVAENVRAIKTMTSNQEIPTFCSWQFSRSAVKAKAQKGQVQEKAGMEDIGMSDEIPQVSSIALAMDQDDSVETMVQRWIRVLKGRSGEVGGFPINWLFDVMDFGQAQPKDKQKPLEYI
jgi:replicative DNA helicase